jgi:hypothetical protein
MDQGRTKGPNERRPIRALPGTPMLEALTRHWNNPKYDVIKVRFLHANILSQNYARLGHARSGIFSSPLLDRKKISFNGRQIICLPEKPNYKISRGAHISQAGFALDGC